MKKRVLILEINEKNFDSIKVILSKKDYESVYYKHLEDVRSELENIYVVLVNTDVDYIDITKLYEIVNSEFTIKVPIVFFSSSKEVSKDLVKKCLDSGASDFIKKPFSGAEILSRVDYHYEQFSKMSEYKLRVDKLANLATVDQISKLTSKMHMQAILKQQIKDFNDNKTPTSILLIGLVNVNKIVGSFGFEYGERLIHMFAKKLKPLVKESDQLSRWQGSNFMMLLKNTDAKGAEVYAKKINSSLSNLEIMKNTKPVLSFGITEFSEDDSFEELEQRSLYAIKEANKQEYGRIYVC